MPTLIHWHEGLFLQPHHLQQFQHATHSALGMDRTISHAFSFGVLQAVVAKDDLEDHRIRFEKLHIIFKSGAVFRYPEEADLLPLDVRKAFQESPDGFTVYVALPLYSSSTSNSIEYKEPPTSTEKIYRVDEVDVSDENTGSDSKQPIQIRRYNGRLIIDDGNRSKNLEYLPVVKVIRQVSGAGAGFPKPDTRYVPPTMLLAGTPVLREMVQSLTSQISSTRNTLGLQLANVPVNLQSLQGQHFESISRLRILNKAAALFTSWLDEDTHRCGCAARIPLYQVYLALCDTLAELTAIYPAKGLLNALPFDHLDPYPCFADLDVKIRSFLEGVAKQPVKSIEFQQEGAWFIGDLDGRPDFFVNSTAYFLAVESPLDTMALARLVEHTDDFKLMPASFGIRAIRGLSLKYEPQPPYEIPQRPGRSYFRITPSITQRVWDQFVKEPSAMIHFERPDLNRFRFVLYATVPPASA